MNFRIQSILQGSTLIILFECKKKGLILNAKKQKLSEVKATQLRPTLCDPMDYIQSMEFSRPEYWGG